MTHVDIIAQGQPLTRLEWKVVALAIREAGEMPVAGDGLVSGLVAWLRRTVTGEPPVRPLGDPRLDALRRFVGLSRRGKAPAPALADELAGFGYSPAQLAAVAQLSR